ncbi:hypothetical protein K501DRAFT_283709 [Backusella circina FSU 941]|nr:hypothetical protein K501DRAFT_283709 [Backusella circina FSU 941]
MIVVNVFISATYLPQYYRIIANKTSQGFSAWFLLLGVVSSISSLFNVILFQWGSAETGKCIEGLAELIQNGIQCFMFGLIFLLFLLYFPEHKKKQQLHHPLLRLEPPQQMISKEWRVSLWIAGFCTGYLAISFFITALLLIFAGSPQEHWLTHGWANFLGALGMISASLKYLPQIWKTWKIKTVGALSIFMLVLQTPGPLLFIYPSTVGPGTSWATILTFMTEGTLQTTLLIMCIVWYFRNKHLGIDNLTIPEEEDVPNERTQLLK